MTIRRATAFALIAAVVLVTSDGRPAPAELPRLGEVPRQILAAILDAMPLLDRESEGRRLFQANCASCHGGEVGGSASDYPPRHNAAGHTWEHGDCELERIIRYGPLTIRPGTAPGLQMPAFRDRLTDDEIRDVIAYIKTMWTPEQRAAQAVTTGASCG